jgi:hypothetical protein
MASDSKWWIVIPVLFNITDNLVQTICLAFYHQGFYFDASTLESQLFLLNGINFLKSGTEFALLGKFNSV